MKNKNTRLSKTAERWVIRAIIAFGTITAIVGIVQLARTAAFVNRAATTDGKVVELASTTGTKKTRIRYAAVFTFKDASGIPHTALSSYESRQPAFRVGDKVTVLYDPRKATHSEIDSFRTLWSDPLKITGFGTFYALLAGFVRFTLRRSAREGKSREI